MQDMLVTLTATSMYVLMDKNKNLCWIVNITWANIIWKYLMCLSEQFHTHPKCLTNLIALIKEILFTRKLNEEMDLIRAKVFTWRTCEPLLLC